MVDTLDYAVTCGYCSISLRDTPGGGWDAACAYLHSAPGRKDFERILKGNLERKRLIDEATSPSDEATTDPNEATISNEATQNEATRVNEATVGRDEATVDPNEATWVKEVVSDSNAVNEESKSQRYKRLNRERINQTQRGRRAQ